MSGGAFPGADIEGGGAIEPGCSLAGGSPAKATAIGSNVPRTIAREPLLSNRYVERVAAPIVVSNDQLHSAARSRVARVD
jgi:hypothetical protein